MLFIRQNEKNIYTFSYCTVDMMQRRVLLLKHPVVSWTEKSTCNMCVNVGDCTEISDSWPNTVHNICMSDQILFSTKVKTVDTLK